MIDSFSQHYHQRTKYDPETISSKSQGLDWSQQPSSYKEYKIGTIYDLKPYLQATKQDVESQWWQRLSHFLLCSYGLTARMQTMGEPMYLRAAPSAGGLYPAEIYLVARGNSLLPAGLYNYQVKDHTLIHFWANDVWQNIQVACFNHPALAIADLSLITTAVFYRSAWRYQDRAYRRIFLDTGHLLGNIELAGAINGFRPYFVGGFIDRQIDELLYLNTEEEGVVTVIPIVDLDVHPDLNIPAFPSALPSKINLEYPELPDGQLLKYCHQMTEIAQFRQLPANVSAIDPVELGDKYNFPFCLKISTATSPISWQDEVPLAGLENTILKRRSTRAYTGGALMLEELNAILDFTYHPQHYIEQDLDPNPDYFDLGLIETFIAVSGVNGLEEGCYYYAPKAQELRQIRFKNFRQELHYLCLGQELGRDAGATIFHTADLQMAVQKYGDRAYRYLHLDAGHLGQRLNLAAIRLDVGVSGIAGFFDDRVNEVLGIPEDEAVLYITTLGRPG
ncbi:SagB/ThcOx family dehydrogenase [Chamaesiphon minutus]|uniref:SagB-type dehydrogenase domain protein n=1 Tax=Chamaesiphon minutus (strain ATCC 27169 / PCC 6605) TaxID=1173020 RepID=K9UQC0_CHAP6|nr:SagB/ThcOx family dehydrogenase [Chamaesiphon minutus]AFY96646.1 SagB-type dehydrogenase domain protein [Chamaesiphon minutus PCC 6605]